MVVVLVVVVVVVCVMVQQEYPPFSFSLDHSPSSCDSPHPFSLLLACVKRRPSRLLPHWTTGGIAAYDSDLPPRAS